MTKVNRQNKREPGNDKALMLLDELILKYYKTLKTIAEAKPKLGEWLKMIELRIKLAPDEKPQAELWKKIDQVRRELLEKDKAGINSSVNISQARPTRMKKELTVASK